PPPPEHGGRGRKRPGHLLGDLAAEPRGTAAAGEGQQEYGEEPSHGDRTSSDAARVAQSVKWITSPPAQVPSAHHTTGLTAFWMLRTEPSAIRKLTPCAW